MAGSVRKEGFTMHLRVKSEVEAKSILPSTASIVVEKIQEKRIITQAKAVKSIPKKAIPPAAIRALIISCQKYQNPDYNTLRAPESDAVKMHRFLRNTRGIPDNNFTILCNETATKDAVMRAMKWLAEFQYGLFYFSGHGYRMPCDGRQVEGLLLHDHEWTRNKMLLDVDIHATLEKMAHCVIILDCCHAGGVASKGLTPGVIKSVVVPKKIDLGKLPVIVPTKDLVFLAACQENQVAYEDPSDGGVFTDALLKIWEQEPEIHYGELHRQLVNQIKYNQDPAIVTQNGGLGMFEI
jgi:hypothetical protein